MQPWAELPLWIPGEENAKHVADNGRAVAAGLQLRPFAETVQDGLQWVQANPQAIPDRMRHAPLSREREAELLATWAALSQTGTEPTEE